MLPEVEEWLAKADEDEQVVRLVLNASGPWSIAAYHVQQAIEKYIKAALLADGTAPPKTHDLVQLLSLASGLVPQAVTEAAAMTSAYAWLTRYPGGPMIDEDDVVEASQHLMKIKQWAMERIHAQP
ncbi:MAG: HEPN domain-containing protein [Fimbriimonas sp.]